GRGGAGGTGKVWQIDSEGARELLSLSAQETRSGIVGVAFSPDGTRVMAGDASSSAVQVWDLGPTGDAEWANLPAPGASGAGVVADGRRGDDREPANRAPLANDRTVDRLFQLRILRCGPRWLVDRPRRQQRPRVLRRRLGGTGVGYLHRRGALADRTPPHRQ